MTISPFSTERTVTWAIEVLLFSYLPAYMLYCVHALSIHHYYICKSWKRLSSVKVLVNYLRREKAKLERLTKFFRFLFLNILKQYLLPNPTIQVDSYFLENSINHGSEASSLVNTRGKSDSLQWLMRYEMVVCVE